jgi:hypothetical protein
MPFSSTASSSSLQLGDSKIQFGRQRENEPVFRCPRNKAFLIPGFFAGTEVANHEHDGLQHKVA